ncbi:hypothetical protein ACFE04_013944 [Oxalis oulophora]
MVERAGKAGEVLDFNFAILQANVAGKMKVVVKDHMQGSSVATKTVEQGDTSRGDEIMQIQRRPRRSVVVEASQCDAAFLQARDPIVSCDLEEKNIDQLISMRDQSLGAGLIEVLASKSEIRSRLGSNMRTEKSKVRLAENDETYIDPIVVGALKKEVAKLNKFIARAKEELKTAHAMIEKLCFPF